MRCGLQRPEHGYLPGEEAFWLPAVWALGVWERCETPFFPCSLFPAPSEDSKLTTAETGPPSLSADPSQVPGSFGNARAGLLGLSSSSITK